MTFILNNLTNKTFNYVKKTFFQFLLLNSARELISSMKAASVTEIKKELNNRPPKELVEICLSLSKFKKENKELLTYLLYEKEDEASYIESVKTEMEIQFDEINKKSNYFIKKSTRKILRNVKKYIRYSKKKATEAELLIHFCRVLKRHHPQLERDTVLFNIYNRQIVLIRKAVSTLHEDLQYDFDLEINSLD